MRREHTQWIKARSLNGVLGECAKATREMQSVFPGLVRVRGHYHCAAWGRRAHWWLKDGSEIVDPTETQFPSCGLGTYEEWIEGSEEPVGKCMICGDECFESRGGGQHWCSHTHLKELERDFA